MGFGIDKMISLMGKIQLWKIREFLKKIMKKIKNRQINL